MPIRARVLRRPLSNAARRLPTAPSTDSSSAPRDPASSAASSIAMDIEDIGRVAQHVGAAAQSGVREGGVDGAHGQGRGDGRALEAERAVGHDEQLDAGPGSPPGPPRPPPATALPPPAAPP